MEQISKLDITENYLKHSEEHIRHFRMVKVKGSIIRVSLKRKKKDQGKIYRHISQDSPKLKNIPSR